MGEYNIDWEKDTIIVDGHVCEKVHFGLYKVTDKYEVFEDVWEEDIRNKGLHYLGEFYGFDKKTVVLYIYYGLPENMEFVRNLRIPGKVLTAVGCIHNGICDKDTSCLYTVSDIIL